MSGSVATDGSITVNLNGKQIISIIVAVVSVLMVSTAQLTDLFGPVMAKTIVSVAGLLNLTLSSVVAAISGTLTQTQQVQQVLDMRGIEHVEVNAKATPALAAMAVDQTTNKIAPTIGAQAAVESIALTEPKAA